MKKFSFAIFALALALAITPAAMADSFNYTFVGSGLDAALTFTGTSNGNGSYTITNVAGTILSAGADITSPVAVDTAPVYNPNGPSGSNIVGSFEYDNQLFPTQVPALDFSGVLFDVNGLFINIYGVGNGYEWADTGSYTNPSNSSDPVAATPEPGSLFLLGTGLFGLAFMRRQAKPNGAVLHS